MIFSILLFCTVVLSSKDYQDTTNKILTDNNNNLPPEKDYKNDSKYVASVEELKEPSNVDHYIYLVRHGERYDGTGCNVALTSNGNKQSNDIADYFFELGSDQPTVLYTSPYVRTIQTAAPTAKKLEKILKIDDALREYRIAPRVEDSVCPTGENLTELLGAYGVDKDDRYKNTQTSVPELNSEVYDEPEEIVGKLRKFLNDNEINEKTNENVAIFTHAIGVLYLFAMLVAPEWSWLRNDFDIPISVASLIVLKKEFGSDQWHFDKIVGNGEWTEVLNAHKLFRCLEKEYKRGLSDNTFLNDSNNDLVIKKSTEKDIESVKPIEEGKYSTNLEPNNVDQYIYLIRHGDREAGNGCDVPLTETGKEQSLAIAEYFFKLGSNQPSVLYTSPYVRTIQTAAPTAKKLEKFLKIDGGLRQYRDAPRIEDSVCPTGESLKKLLDEYDVRNDDKYINTETSAPELNSEVYDEPEDIAAKLGKFLDDNRIDGNLKKNVAMFTHSTDVMYLVTMLIAPEWSFVKQDFDIAVSAGSIVVLKNELGSDQWHFDKVEMGNWTNDKDALARFIKKNHLEAEYERGLTDEKLKSGRKYLK